MPKPTTKRRQRAEQAPADDDIFAHFAAYGRPDAAAQRQEEKPPKTDPNDQLIERISALEGELQESRRRQMMAAPPAAPQQTQPVTPRSVKFDPTGLPDPLDDKDKFANELSLRLNAFVDAREQAIRQEMTQQNNQTSQAERLWNEFTQAHPEWTEYPDIVESVATRVTQRALQQGIDPQKYMFQNTQVFFSDVAQELNERYGRLVADGGEEEEAEPERRTMRRTRANPEAEEEDEGRTAGIFTGAEGGGRPATRRSERGSDMIEDLHKLQRASGFW